MMLQFTWQQSATMRGAIHKFGKEKQEDIAIEELSELTKAIIKHRRYGTEETRQNIIEEIADVHIMLQQLLLIHGFNGFDAVTEEKLRRLEQRIKEGGGNA